MAGNSKLSLRPSGKYAGGKDQNRRRRQWRQISFVKIEAFKPAWLGKGPRGARRDRGA